MKLICPVYAPAGGMVAGLNAKVQLALRTVTRFEKDVPVTLTAVPLPVFGTGGAGRLTSLEVTSICESGIELAPLVSAVMTLALMLICPALLRTSTGKVALVAVTLKPGTAPFQFTAVLLLVTGAMLAAGIVGATLNATVSTVLLAVGKVPVPTRKKMNLPILMTKSNLAVDMFVPVVPSSAHAGAEVERPAHVSVASTQ